MITRTEAAEKLSGRTAYFSLLVGLAGMGLALSVYLTLYQIGWVGSLQCGLEAQGCEVVQTSTYSSFLGIPVSIWGGGWYLLVGLVSGAGWGNLLARSARRFVLRFLAWTGLLFTFYLTYIELFVLHAICWWCVGSAILVVAIFTWTRAWQKPAPRNAQQI